MGALWEYQDYTTITKAKKSIEVKKPHIYLL